MGDLWRRGGFPTSSGPPSAVCCCTATALTHFRGGAATVVSVAVGARVFGTQYPSGARDGGGACVGGRIYCACVCFAVSVVLGEAALLRWRRLLACVRTLCPLWDGKARECALILIVWAIAAALFPAGCLLQPGVHR